VKLGTLLPRTSLVVYVEIFTNYWSNELKFKKYYLQINNLEVIRDLKPPPHGEYKKTIVNTADNLVMGKKPGAMQDND